MHNIVTYLSILHSVLHITYCIAYNTCMYLYKLCMARLKIIEWWSINENQYLRKQANRLSYYGERRHRSVWVGRKVDVFEYRFHFGATLIIYIIYHKINVKGNPWIQKQNETHELNYLSNWWQSHRDTFLRVTRETVMGLHPWCVCQENTHESLTVFSGITLLVAWDATIETAVCIMGGSKRVLCWSREPGYLVSHVGHCQCDNKKLRKQPFLEKHGNKWQLGSTEHLRSTGWKRLGLLGETVSSGCSVGKVQDEPETSYTRKQGNCWLLGPIRRILTRVPVGFLYLACFQGSPTKRVSELHSLLYFVYSRICWWTFELSLPSGDCEWTCYKH